MALDNIERRVVYEGDGSQKDFPFSFVVFKDSDITVSRSIDENRDETVATTEYSVELSDDGTGTVHFVEAPAEGIRIAILSAVPETQPMKLTTYDGFDPEVLNDSADRIVALIQQLLEKVQRAVILSPTDPMSANTLRDRLFQAAKEALESAQSAEEALAACVQIRQLIEQYSWDIPHIVDSLRDVENYPHDGLFWVGGFGKVLPGQDISNRYVKANGSTTQRTLGERFSDVVNVRDFGAVGDGQHDDTEAIQAAIASNCSVIFFPEGVYKTTENVSPKQGQTLVGCGTDYWDTHRPDAQRLLKSVAHGTHLLFCGSGERKFVVRGVSNERSPKTVNDTVCSFTDFTLRDAVGNSPATPKPFSVGVCLTHNSGICNMRILLNFNGINGYNDATSEALGDDWDVGLWVQDGNEALISNVQVCGYWRMAGTLLTENDGSLTMRGNPERIRFINFFTQGVRGLLIRNMPQIEVLSNTTDSITIAANPTLQITAFSSCIGTNSDGTRPVLTFTGSPTDDDGNVVLTGVSPAITGTLNTIRYPNMGNNFSNTVFENAWICSLEHTSQKDSTELGLPLSFAFEVDGFPVRNLVFINTKIQTVNDFGNSLFGGCNDFKFIASEFEGGELVAYSTSESPAHATENLRIVGSMISNSVGMSGFNPRSAYIDSEQFPTQWGSDAFKIKNWRNGDIEIQYPDGARALLVQKDGGISVYRKGISSSIFKIEQSGNVSYIANAFSIDTIKNGAALRIYASKNAEFGGKISPITDNAQSIGTGAKRWSEIFAGTGTINTSDARLKTSLQSPTDALMRAWGKVNYQIFQFNDAVEKKGADARLHVGVVAQQVIEAFASEGLDATRYGLLCYDEWDDQYEDVEVVDQPEELNEDGEVLTPAVTHIEHRKVLDAGNRYGIRYEEALALEAAYQRWQLNQLKKLVVGAA